MRQRGQSVLCCFVQRCKVFTRWEAGVGDVASFVIWEPRWTFPFQLPKGVGRNQGTAEVLLPQVFISSNPPCPRLKW